MNDINISVDKVNVLGNEFVSLISDYHDVIEKIKVQVNDIHESNIWIGTDSDQFLEATDKYFASFSSVESTLKFYSDFLIQSGAIYQTLENDYSSRSSYE